MSPESFRWTLNFGLECPNEYPGKIIITGEKLLSTSIYYGTLIAVGNGMEFAKAFLATSRCMQESKRYSDWYRNYQQEVFATIDQGYRGHCGTAAGAAV